MTSLPLSCAAFLKRQVDTVESLVRGGTTDIVETQEQLDVTMAPKEPQPRVEGVSLSGAMARQGG